LVPVPPPVVGVPVPPEGVVVGAAAVVVGAAGVVSVAAEVDPPPVVDVSLPDVVDVVLDELELDAAFDAAMAVSAAEVGTVNGGAPETSGVDEPPPPQAVRPTLSVSATRAADRRVRRRTRARRRTRGR
jgi:hypothetical protein